MKSQLLPFLLLSSAAFSQPQLVQLKTRQATSSSRIGVLTAKLLSATDKRVVETFSQDLGDCATCARGAAVKGIIGMRLEGTDIDSLQISRKQSSNVKIEKCSDKAKAGQHRSFACLFESGPEHFALVLKVEPAKP